MKSKGKGDLRPGTKVEVVRVNGEPERGIIARGPLAHLVDFGDFYLVRRTVPQKARQAGVGMNIGMYYVEDLRILES